MILLRPFPFRGDHFFNLQWRSGAKNEHFACGNVGRHLRALYEAAIERFFATRGWEFGMVGPKLLSDYIASDAGAELRDRLFDPAFFNAIDWTEIDRFDESLAQLAVYLNDERLFGIHLWTARNDVARRQEGTAGRCWPTHQPRRPPQHRQNRYTGKPPLLCPHLRPPAGRQANLDVAAGDRAAPRAGRAQPGPGVYPRDREDARTRLLVAFGTGLYVEAAAGELRHGPTESSPANALFVADPPAHRLSTILILA